MSRRLKVGIKEKLRRHSHGWKGWRAACLSVDTIGSSKENQMTSISPDRNDRIEKTLETFLEKIQQLDTKVSQLDTKVSQLDTKVSQLDTDVRKANERTDTYWEASKLLINVAFALIATAVITIIVPAVLG